MSSNIITFVETLQCLPLQPPAPKQKYLKYHLEGFLFFFCLLF